MIKTIRKSKVSKVIACYLAIQMIVQMTQPIQLWALTAGPSQPEFNAFTPIGTSDMVNLSSGNFNYNIPIMDVGGYPLNLAYDSGITMDQEASWVGLGWNLNVGQIVRDVRGLPDDFSGDTMIYENDMKTNRTVGVGFNATVGYAGIEGLKANTSIIIQNNTFEGLTFKKSKGIGYQLNDNVRIGLDISASVGDGATVTPTVSLSGKTKENEDNYTTSMTGSVGISYNTRKALESVNLGFSVNTTQRESYLQAKNLLNREITNQAGASGGATISFNNNTFTPTKRAGIAHGNFSFAQSVGATVYGVDLQGQVNGFGSFQKINKDDRHKEVPAFGYENTEKGEGFNGVLDFNREKDRTFNKHTTALPVSNYTHDVYAIQGQGIAGMFRPHRSQVSYLYDHRVIDQGTGGSLGVKFGIGWNFYSGGKQEVSPSFGETGKWVEGNKALGKFVETKNDLNSMDYESSYFKMVGDRSVDKESSLFTQSLHGSSPMKLEISGSKFHRRAEPSYRVKNKVQPQFINTPKLKRKQRDLRNQNIFKISQKEALNDPLIKRHHGNYVLDHHTAGMKILKPDGSTYVYGETAYNTKKVEATFDVSGRSDIHCTDGTVGFSNPKNDSSKFSDQYLNKITTPAYAHSYMLTSVLSSDYEDIDANGPSPNDLGAYTLFEYEVADDNYKWRMPYDGTKASFNEGLKSNEDDEKGNYLYGEKELKYIKKIETKTHTAIFHLSDRKDGRGARRENPSKVSTVEGYMQKIDSISLYSKPEYDVLGGNASYIKRAHFEYGYKLCKGVPNNLERGGKLTLEKVYFTFRNSKMGKYTPYVFNYNGFNPDYNLKSYDIWGNYKPVVKEMVRYNTDGEVAYEINEDGKEVPILNPTITNPGIHCRPVEGSLLAAEFPFVQQDDKKLQDAFAAAWTLTSIDLPSGGSLELAYESDDYQYVQDRKAMQMFKITGAHNTASINNVDEPILYDGNTHRKYIFTKLSDKVLDVDDQYFIDNYLGDQINKPIQFRALLQMVKGSAHQYDYVSGYFRIDRTHDIQILKSADKGTYAAIPLEFLNKEGGFIQAGNGNANPIAKAGWYFGRTYLNRQVYSLNGNATNDNLEEIINEIIGQVGAIAEIFVGPNGRLQQKRSSQEFIPNKSWVRLLNPTKRKLGGGVRVKEIKMLDKWGAMVDNSIQDNPNYSQFYGQQYSYTDTDGFSSGVASFEPNGSKENPFVEPFYDDKPNGANFGKDKLLSPQASNYTEKPFGESFFPASTVTYSRVEVKNLPRTRTEKGNTYAVKKSATGTVVNEFYTTKNFPTVVDYTDITKANDQTSILANILTLGVNDRNHLTLSQGFTIETNDMNGRMKGQQVYAENDKLISEVVYNYNVGENGQLDNKLPVIDNKGNVITDQSIGTHYEVVNEFRENKSSTKLVGLNVNLTGFVVLIYPVIIPIPLPSYSNHQDILRTATTTKVIHKSGILVEKIARDLGSEVSTKNLAWDAVTGEVLLTKTVNEYDDYYYNFNYPAYWGYEGMGLASKNIGISGYLKASNDTPPFTLADKNGNNKGEKESTIFYQGDELITIDKSSGVDVTEKLWVIYADDDEVHLMDQKGFVINQQCSPFTKGDLSFKIVRSGFRNQQMASMASVTSMVNPIDTDNNGEFNNFDSSVYNYNGRGTNPKIVNASAVGYTDYWQPQQEDGLPSFSNELKSLYDLIHKDTVDGAGNEPSDEFYISNHAYGFNPYLYNVRGDWRAIKSYAYLTRRDANLETANFSTKSKGYFTKFNSFYTKNANDAWKKDKTNWTFASQVTQYSPWGAELENKDALDRYSAAQYGYQYTLPVAVASNSEYAEIGFDGFEDYPITTSQNTEEIKEVDHFSFADKLDANLERVNTDSHTGNYSLAVKNGVTATMTRSLEDCEEALEVFSCVDDNQQPHNSVLIKRIEECYTNVNSQQNNKLAVERYIIKGGQQRANKVLYGFKTFTTYRLEDMYIRMSMYNTVDSPAVLGQESLKIIGQRYSILYDCSLTETSVTETESIEVLLDENGNADFKLEVYAQRASCAPNDLFRAEAEVRLELYDEIGKQVLPQNNSFKIRSEIGVSRCFFNSN